MPDPALYRPVELERLLREKDWSHHRKHWCVYMPDCCLEAGISGWTSYSCSHCPGVKEGEEVEREPFIPPKYGKDVNTIGERQCANDGCAKLFLPETEGQRRCPECRGKHVYPRKRKTERMEKILELRRSGMVSSEIAIMLNIPVYTVYYTTQRYGKE